MKVAKVTQVLFFVCLYVNISSWGQQTPVFSDYYYNTVIINPAYAGFYSSPDIVISNRGYINKSPGSPKTLGASFSTSIRDRKVGLSFSAISDEVGVTKTTNVTASYAYKIFFDRGFSVSKKMNSEYIPNVMSFGISGGMLFYNEDLLSLNIPNDPKFDENINVNVPVIGLGFLYQSETFYSGISSTNILGNILAPNDNIDLEAPIYIYAGYRIFPRGSSSLIFKPNALLKTVFNTTQIDLNMAVNYQNSIEFGVGYRSNNSVNFVAGVYLKDHFRVLLNYNASINNVPIKNTLGIILNFRMGEGFKHQ